jgi:hypothetical protein
MKNIPQHRLKEQERRKNYKDDAVNATPSMGTPTGGSRASERTKLSMRRKVAERLVSARKNSHVNYLQ